MSKTLQWALARAAPALALLASLGAPIGARADEQIVLPFDCQVAGGAVRAVPSSDQAYRIYGAREQRRVESCSHRDPERCRSFMVHRFTMACGPHRVSWPEFYAAISEETDGRAYLDRGRLYYRLGARWNRRDNYGFDYPFPDRRAGGGGVVELPPGFAPLAGTQAIFTPLDPRIAALEDREPEPFAGVDADGLPIVRAPDQSQEPPVPIPAPAAKTAREPGADEKKPFVPVTAKPPAPVAVEKPVAETKAAPAAAPKPPIETSSTEKVPPAEPMPVAPVAPAPQAAVAPPPAAAVTPMAPTILNSPAAKQVQAAAAEHKTAAGTVVAASEIAVQPVLPSPAAGPSVRGWEEAVRGPSRALSRVVFAIVIAAATLGLLLVILKRQAAVPAGYAAGERDPVEPVLPGFAPRPGHALVVHETPDPPLATGLSAAPSGMPATRDEALAVLGLSADATDAAIRKVVDALRQSWHPDMAAGGEDRLQREERLKRINVASDILLRRPAA